MMTNTSAIAAQLVHLKEVPLSHGVLAVLVCVAAVIDWRTLRLPNWLTFGTLACGLAVSAVHPAPDESLWRALGGALAGLGCTLPFYVLRVMGAGDTKLMAGVGAFLGFPAVLGAVVYTFIAGGIAAIAFALWRRSLKRFAANVIRAAQGLVYTALAGVHSTVALPRGASVGKLPYGLAICAGTLAWLVFPFFL